MRQIAIAMASIVAGWAATVDAQTPAMTLQDMLARCPKADDVAELKQCVSQLLDLQRVTEKSQEVYMDLVAECADRQTVESMRTCVRVLGGQPPSSPGSAAPPATSLPPPLPPKPEWLVREEASRMDGSPSVFLTLLADEPVASRYGATSHPSLHVRCRERTTSLFIAGNWYLGTDVPMMIRLDQDKPVAQTWRPSTDSKATGLWNGGQAIPFIKSLLGHETLLVRVTPFQDAPVEVAFSVGGLAKVIEPLRKACQW